MSPIVRGRPIAQIDSSGRVKTSFDVLLWAEGLSQKAVRMLDELQQLREYLGSIYPVAITINLWLPNSFARVHSFLNAYDIATSPVAIPIVDAAMTRAFGEQAPTQMCEAAATALICDADMVVTENSDWYPYYEEFARLGVLLGSPQVM